MNSLGKQLQVGLAIGLLLFLGLLWWGGSLALRNLTEGFVASRLQHDAETLLATLDLSNPEKPVLSVSGFGNLYHQPLSGHYYQVMFSDGALLTSRSLWDQRMEFPVFTPGTSDHWRMAGPSGQLIPRPWHLGHEPACSGFNHSSSLHPVLFVFPLPPDR